jgi:hypothetical protein
MDEFRCTISFVGEAYETAAAHYRDISGYMVEVETVDGEVFDAYIGGPDYLGASGAKKDPLRVNDENGQYEVLLARVDQDTSELTGEAGYVGIYDDIRRVTVY